MSNLVLKKVAYITVLYNSISVVSDFLRSIIESQGVEVTLCIISNEPEGECERIVKDVLNSSSVRYEIIKNESNVGVAAANNQGVRWALERGFDHIIIGNNDVEFGPEVIGNLLRHSTLSNGVISPLIAYHSVPQRLWYGGGSINLPLGRSPHLECDVHERLLDAPSELEQTQYAPTCFLLVPREAFAVVGLFDERFFVYYDDTDWVHRLRVAGLNISIDRSCLVYHKVSTSTGGELTPFSVFYANRNRIFIVRKHLGKWISAPFCLVISVYALTALVIKKPSLVSTGWRGLAEGFSMQ